MEKIRVAVVGCGGIFKHHWLGYKEQIDAGYTDFEIVAFCDLIVERAQNYAQKYTEATGIQPCIFDSFDAMFASDLEYDVVALQVPHYIHHTLAIRCMRAGKHVMIEKPLAITMRAAKQLMDVARECGVTLKLMENYRHFLLERTAAWVVKSGMIGTPRLMNMMDIGLRQWYWDWRDHKYKAGGAWTLDSGVHFCNVFQNVLGPIRRVQGAMASYDNIRYQKNDAHEAQGKLHYRQTRSLLQVNPETLGDPIEVDVEDTTSAILEFENGVIGTWVVCRAAPGKINRSISVAGSDGTLVWGEGIYDYSEKLVYSFDQLQEMYLNSLTPAERDLYFPRDMRNAVGLEQREFFNFLKGERELEVTDETGYHDMAIPYAVYESAVSGHAVLVDDILSLKEETYQSEINKFLGIE